MTWWNQESLKGLEVESDLCCSFFCPVGVNKLPNELHLNLGSQGVETGKVMKELLQEIEDSE